MTKHRLLVIEDDPRIAELVCRAADGLDFQTRSACDVSQIEALYTGFTPDVIVLDIVMPGMDGFEVLRYLHEQKSRSRVVILSAQENYLPMAARMGEGLALTIEAHIAKPFRLVELYHVFENIKNSLVPLEADHNAVEAA